MSKYDYDMSRQLVRDEPPFYALVMAAMRAADSENIERLRSAFPDVYEELVSRYNAPGGVLASDRPADQHSAEQKMEEN